MATSINTNWGPAAVKIQQSADRVQRSDWMSPGDGARGEALLDSYVPLDHDYTSKERAQQQAELREMLKRTYQDRMNRAGHP